jgi:lipopolysaccharide/colanic/teichoic acid biosynthesis glycosyltransferase
MAKRLLDLIVSSIALLVFSPLLIVVCFLVWLQDYHSPFYIAPRVGKKEKMFKMIKIRSMVINADKSGVDSTSNNDRRITGVGRFIRKFKLDEISQLINVFIGDMSLVGPRPNVKRETDMYTPAEKKLLVGKPGITDFASIVFSDEGDILKDSKDPDLDYNQIIRPWKSRLALANLEHSSLVLDLKVLVLTAVAIVDKSKALAGLVSTLEALKVDPELIRVAKRHEPLQKAPPPGASEIVTSRI